MTLTRRKRLTFRGADEHVHSLREEVLGPWHQSVHGHYVSARTEPGMSAMDY